MEAIKNNNIKSNNGWWNRKRHELSALFGGKLVSPKLDEMAETKNRDLDTDEEIKIKETKDAILKKLEDFKNKTSLDVEDDKLTDAINTFLLYEEDKMTLEGFSDGGIGVRNKKISGIVTSRASYIVEHAKTITSGRVKGLENEMSILKATISERKNEYEKQKVFYDKLLDIRRHSSRNFSIPMGILYIVFGICMMGADFPISVGIAEHFIDVNRSIAVGSFLTRVKNLDILLFSLGITFLSIYFKIFYDEFINKDIIKRETEEPLWNFGIIIRLLVKLGILCILIYTLITLGNIRNALNTSSIEPQHPLFVTSKQVFDFRGISFIATTVLLPLISGICLSVGIGFITNSHNCSRVKKSCNRLTGKLEMHYTDLRSLERKHALLVNIKDEWLNEIEKKNCIELQLTSAYDRGYRWGHKLRYGFDLFNNANALYIAELTNHE